MVFRKYTIELKNKWNKYMVGNYVLVNKINENKGRFFYITKSLYFIGMTEPIEFDSKLHLLISADTISYGPANAFSHNYSINLNAQRRDLVFRVTALVDGEVNVYFLSEEDIRFV